MKIGFVLITYRLDLVRRLTDALTSSPVTAGVAIHHDRKSGPLKVAFRNPESVAVVENPVEVHWGDWSQIQAAITGIELLESRFPEHDWIVLLSGQDYPTRPLTELADFLAGSDADACIDCSPAIANWGVEEVRYRYGYDYLTVPGWVPFGRLSDLLQRYPRFVSSVSVADGRHCIGIRHRRASVDDLYGGSEWFMTNRRATGTIVRAYHDPAVARRFRRVLLPTEVFYTTVMNNSGHKIDVAHRYYQFETKNAHPEVLTEASLPDIDVGRAFFARKMDPVVSASLLDILDRRLARDLPPRVETDN
jgi:hypothetical protein